ncbi:monocarboxylate permease-like protein [Xylaria bambusicola]|uniref:monocarboxylate permease-like protein n=1 Tax=Xylaria bambusicola TaxID=326684 RepID=UPI002008B98E|nr:monocarboxylate permease-like protein [Xylaria bambusicola]KAI0506399.1 monocarboxylate permease-like protein [Xylaria bambusicola]
MPGSDSGSSTTRYDQNFDISAKNEIGTAEASQETSIMEKNSIEQVSSRENTNIDIEKGGAEVVSTQPAAVPGFNPDDFPDGGLEAWLVVVGGALILFCSFGLVNCSGVFVEYYVNGPLSDYTSSDITWITSLQAFLVTGSNLIMGRLFDSYGTRWLLPIGTVIYSLGLMLLSLSTKYYQIVLTQGIVSGIGAACVFNCASNSTITWFFRYRAAALGIVVAGSSVGGIVLPILMSHLIPKIGFPWTVRILGFIVLVFCGIASFTVKSRLPPRPKPFHFAELIAPFKEVRFALVVVGAFFFFWGLYLPFNYLNIQAQQQGISPSLIPYILPIVNAVSVPGRIIPGILADRLGRFNMMIIIATLSGVITLALWVPGHTTGTTLAFGAVYGFTSGAFISLAPAVIAQISDIRQIGARSGVLLFISSLGALTGSPIGGAIVTAEHGEYLGLKLFTGIAILLAGVFVLLARTVQVGLKIVKI